jgi:K+-sensing histidine kinase KdpD
MIEVSRTLTASIELNELLSAIMEKIIGVIEPAEVGTIMLWDQSAGVFRPGVAYGYDFEIYQSMGLRAGEAITGKVFDTAQARMLANPHEVAQDMQDMRPANRSARARALGTDRLPICTLAAPIFVREQKFGVLVLEILHGPETFTPEDLPFVQTIADLIALAIERVRLSARADSLRATRQTERMRSELMATVSHELRLPLTAIKGYATALLLEEVDWSQQKRSEFLHLIEEECVSMESMLTDILDSSLIEDERLAIETEPLRLPKIALEIAREQQHRTTRHHIIVDFPPEFPIVAADCLWIKQVFRNILDNAIKYSPEGGLILIHGEERFDDVVIHISDQGIGISPEDLIVLFEKYFRARLPTGLQIPGTGLGLPIARAIVESHGGRIWAESKIGEGTTLSFSLPLTNSTEPSV